MADDLEHAKKRLDDEYGQIRRRFDEIHQAFDEVSGAKPGDDVRGKLKDLEKRVRKVRTGGIFRPGANQYERVRKKWLRAKEDAESGGSGDQPVQKF